MPHTSRSPCAQWCSPGVRSLVAATQLSSPARGPVSREGPSVANGRNGVPARRLPPAAAVPRPPAAPSPTVANGAHGDWSECPASAGAADRAVAAPSPTVANGLIASFRPGPRLLAVTKRCLTACPSGPLEFRRQSWPLQTGITASSSRRLPLRGRVGLRWLAWSFFPPAAPVVRLSLGTLTAPIEHALTRPQGRAPPDEPCRSCPHPDRVRGRAAQDATDRAAACSRACQGRKR